ncbi:MAG: hypothetical protein GC165_00270 [Armatimonadetes bacterium]|nr:hypothetical protein [Armatimonadota bacterium]
MRSSVQSFSIRSAAAIREAKQVFYAPLPGLALFLVAGLYRGTVQDWFNFLVVAALFLLMAFLGTFFGLRRLAGVQKIEVDEAEIRHFGQGEEPVLVRRLDEVETLSAKGLFEIPSHYVVEFRDGSRLTFMRTIERCDELTRLLSARTGLRWGSPNDVLPSEA